MAGTDIGPEEDWQVKTSSAGEGHDCCPNCGSSVEAAHVLGHPERPYAFIYGHDLRAGGCGATWNRTTSEGIRRAPNANPKWPTSSVARGRVISLPSERFRANYERAFGHA